MKFATKYSPPKSPAVTFTEPSFTDQSQKKDCDINVILDRYKETGYLVDPLHQGTRKPVFGDFTEVPDYQGCLDLIREADARFMELPAAVRDRFGNNPQEIFDFIANENNREEAIKLGLISPPTTVPKKEEEQKAE